MSLGPLPTALLVPPVNLLFAGLGGLLVARRRARLGAAIAGASLLALLVLSLPAVSKLLIVSLETGLPLVTPPGSPPAAIVILSGDTTHDGLDVGFLTLERERAGAALQRRTGLPILVTGGQLDGTSRKLADMMAESLATDFQAQVRWREGEAQDTRQNATLSAAILRADAVGSIYLVTHAWHMKRALLAFAHTGITVTAAPVRLDPLPRADLSEFVPRTSAWLESYYALHEWIGCAGSILRFH